MAASGWLTRWLADVPDGDGWLSSGERTTYEGLRAARRRESWLLGRWAAKAAVAAWTGASPDEVEIASRAGGAPEAIVAGERRGPAVSLSHREGRALAVVCDCVAIGCDLEPVEPRSAAFVSTWLAPDERAMLRRAGDAAQAPLANLLWTAKEAAAKARHEGLRLDVGRAMVELEWEAAPDGLWRPLLVRWDPDGRETRGWWRQEPAWVLAVVGEPPSPAPVSLEGP